MSAVNNTQRVIKGFAIALAVFLMMVIGSALVAGISFLGYLAWGNDVSWSGQAGDWSTLDLSVSDVRDIEINIKATPLKLRQAENDSDRIRIDTNSNYIETWSGNGKLSIVEKSHGFFGWGGSGEVIIYLPEKAVFEDFNIEIGAGTLEAELINARTLKLNLGAGRTSIGMLNVKDSAQIDGGTGFMEIRDGGVRNLDLEVGAGRADLRLKLAGDNRIESGVGRLDLDLVGDEDDYRLDVSKGIGSVTMNGSGLGDDAVWGKGDTRVRIDAGVGSVEMKTVAE